MVETKGILASSSKDENPVQVNSTVELREWCARQRKFLVTERDAAKTPDAKLIRTGMLRMLNNVESVLIQASTSFTKHPLPVTFPRTFDELSALLLDYYDLPRTFSITDLLNERWRFQVIKDHPYHKGPILTLNRFAREKDLMNAILQVIADRFHFSGSIDKEGDQPKDILPPMVTPRPPDLSRDETVAREQETETFTCPCGRSYKSKTWFETHQKTCPGAQQGIAPEVQDTLVPSPGIEPKFREKSPPMALLVQGTVSANDTDLQEKTKGIDGRGRKMGAVSTRNFECQCGRVFKYEKAYTNHQATCPKAKNESARGRHPGETFAPQFTCACGKAFKYEKAFESHKKTCIGRE